MEELWPQGPENLPSTPTGRLSSLHTLFRMPLPLQLGLDAERTPPGQAGQAVLPQPSRLVLRRVGPGEP